MKTTLEQDLEYLKDNIYNSSILASRGSREEIYSKDKVRITVPLFNPHSLMESRVGLRVYLEGFTVYRWKTDGAGKWSYDSEEVRNAVAPAIKEVSDAIRNYYKEQQERYRKQVEAEANKLNSFKSRYGITD